MPLAAIRAAVKTKIETVANVGRVWPYEPHVAQDADIPAYFVPVGLAEIRAWTITRESTAETDTAPGNTCVNFATHLVVIRHWQALGAHAATEEAFQDRLEAVRDVFRAEQTTLFGLASVFRVGPPSVRVVEARTLLGILCHYAELTLPVTEQA